MILYLDTSAMVKLFVQEVHSDSVNLLYSESELPVTSVVAFAECTSALRRKVREKHLTRKAYHQLILNVSKEYLNMGKVPISNEIDEIIIQLLEKYPLRGFDAIHLASALLMKYDTQLDVKFACFNKQLNSFAKEESLDAPF